MLSWKCCFQEAQPAETSPVSSVGKRLWKCVRCIQEQQLNAETSAKNRRDYPWDLYSLKELQNATNNFHDDNKIGEGGFGSIYWGRTNNGDEIAVKRMKAMTAKGEMEFAVEVEMLGRVRHKNLLGLRGFYAGGDERLIVYDFMKNHSLLTHLHGQLASQCSLDWPRRVNIAIGSAEGIAYLHHEAEPHIIHRDIKASNILLDSKFQAKVADFGFAKLIPEGVTHLTTRVKGTLGYLAPEYAMWGKVSENCDVYSFGVLLLEIVSGKKPIEKLPGGVKRDIVRWATPYVEKGALEHVVDPRLNGKYNRAQLKSIVEIAVQCTDSNAENRPTMLHVVEWLQEYCPGLRKKDERPAVIQDHETEGDDDQTEISAGSSVVRNRSAKANGDDDQTEISAGSSVVRNRSAKANGDHDQTEISAGSSVVRNRSAKANGR